MAMPSRCTGGYNPGKVKQEHPDGVGSVGLSAHVPRAPAKANLSFLASVCPPQRSTCHHAEILVGHGVRLVVHHLEMRESRTRDFMSTDAVLSCGFAMSAGLPRVVSAGPICLRNPPFRLILTRRGPRATPSLTSPFTPVAPCSCRGAISRVSRMRCPWAAAVEANAMPLDEIGSDDLPAVTSSENTTSSRLGLLASSVAVMAAFGERNFFPMQAVPFTVHLQPPVDERFSTSCTPHGGLHISSRSIIFSLSGVRTTFFHGYHLVAAMDCDSVRYASRPRGFPWRSGLVTSGASPSPG